MSSRLGRKKKPSTEEALQQVKELCEQYSKRKRKPVRFEINTDPKTGLRDFKGTYDSSRRCSRRSDVIVPAECSSEMCEPDDFSYEDNQVKGESLEDLITHCKTLLESMGSTEYVESNWTKRMTDMQEDWTKGWSFIFNWVVSDENHHSDKCSFCFGSDANVRCHQCGLSFYMCNICDERLHSSNPFHDREIWNGRFFEAVAPMEKFDGYRKTGSGT
ncbi:Hypothetical predicted protein, partial [Paramuricea clavata]